MMDFLVAGMPTLPVPSIKIHHVSSTDSIRSSTSSRRDDYFTPQLSIRSHRTISDAGSIASDYQDCLSTSSASKSPKSKVHIKVSLVNDEAEFFAVIVPEDTPDVVPHEECQTPKAERHRDKIRSLFHKRSTQSDSDEAEAHVGDWNEALANALSAMHADVQQIITGLDDVDHSTANNVPALLEDPALTAPRMSFAERQRSKLYLMRMAQMLYPPNLLTYHTPESPYPYTDIIAPRNVHLLRMKRNLPFDRMLIQHRPFRHKKLRYRTQRCLLRIRRDFRRLKQDIYGGETLKSHKELPSLSVQNYRNRLERTLLEVRMQIAEYDRVHALARDHRPSISQIIAQNFKGQDSLAQAKIEDYRTKLRPIEYVEKDSSRHLISAPFITRRARQPVQNALTSRAAAELVDKRFDPSTFVDLVEEADRFFDDELPFWDRPTDTRTSVSTSTPLKRASASIALPAKAGLWNRIVFAIAVKQRLLSNVNLPETEDERIDELLTFTSTSEPHKERHSLPVFHAAQRGTL